VNCRGSIKTCKYKISLVFDMIEHWRDSVCQGKVEGPIGRGGETHGFCANVGRKDFRGISPKFVSDEGEALTMTLGPRRLQNYTRKGN